jgi:hypothetical protein
MKLKKKRQLRGDDDGLGFSRRQQIKPLLHLLRDLCFVEGSCQIAEIALLYTQLDRLCNLTVFFFLFTIP